MQRIPCCEQRGGRSRTFPGKAVSRGQLALDLHLRTACPPCFPASTPALPCHAVPWAAPPLTQVLICGKPPGSNTCLNTDYNASLPVLVPDSVAYNGMEYTGETGRLGASQRPRLAGTWTMAQLHAGGTRLQDACLHHTFLFCTLPPRIFAATYIFNLTDALLTPPVTYRYLTCLYNDTRLGVAKRAGASLDVVRCGCAGTD